MDTVAPPIRAGIAGAWIVVACLVPVPISAALIMASDNSVLLGAVVFSGLLAVLAALVRAIQRSRHPPLTTNDRAFVELTRREREILALIAEGRTNQEICDRLWLSMPTVKTLIGNLFAKTAARDRVQLVLHALRTGVVVL